MSDPKLDGSNPDQTSNPSVDDLLAEVQKMADQVETLIDPARQDKDKQDKQEEAAKPAQPAAALAAEPPNPANSEAPAEPAAESPSPDTEKAAVPESPATEVPIDPNTKALADAEINQVLDRIQKKDAEPTPESAAGDQEDTTLLIQSLPVIFRKLRGFLLTFDSLFAWVPARVKSMLGYLGLLIIVATAFLWITVLCFVKK